MTMVNPLQKYFRQPKLFISVPSKGLYSKPGTYAGDINQLPVYGMTGMDEIILRTPDALLSGESTANIIASCVPAIKDPWEISIIDSTLILAAIRIATYGNEMHVSKVCTNCGEENEYDINLNRVIEHYMPLQFNNKIVLKDFTINIQPLTYRQSTEFNLKNFRLQQQIAQASAIQDEAQQQETVNNIFRDLGALQAEIFMDIIESVETTSERVTERQYIVEWLANCDKEIYDAIKEQNQLNNDAWTIPKFPVKCTHCDHESSITVDLDNSNFFAQA